MDDLRKRFGRLLAAHRRRRGLTQEALAEAADLSPDMIAKIEVGATGARFPAIERLSEALEIDPAELFTSEIPSGAIRRGSFTDVSTMLAHLSEPEMAWVRSFLEVVLKRPPQETLSNRAGSHPMPKSATKLRNTKGKLRGSRSGI
jgi:transcriptional regulator with XRE-family HTH domain